MKTFLNFEKSFGAITILYMLFMNLSSHFFCWDISHLPYCHIIFFETVGNCCQVARRKWSFFNLFNEYHRRRWSPSRGIREPTKNPTRIRNIILVLRLWGHSKSCTVGGALVCEHASHAGDLGSNPVWSGSPSLKKSLTAVSTTVLCFTFLWFVS